jgi:hypothetical protein
MIKGGEEKEGKEGRGGVEREGWDGVNPPPRKQILTTALNYCILYLKSTGSLYRNVWVGLLSN